MQEPFLYHYYEHDFGPFQPLTALEPEAARQILQKEQAAGRFHHPDIDGFLQKRYDRDQALREKFRARGGHAPRTSPVYMMLGDDPQWATAYENPAVVKIPLSEIDPKSVSFTYGDSFAILDPALFDGQEYWNQLYFRDEILDVLDRNGYPPRVHYDFKRSVYPKDKHLNHHLKYVEAQVWNDDLFEKYRNKGARVSMAEQASPTLTRWQKIRQALLFLVVSVSAGAIEIGSFALLDLIPALKDSYWPKYLPALILSVLFSFTINRRYTFQSAANVPIAMLQLTGYYVVFTAVSTWGGNWAATQPWFAGKAWGEFLVLGVTMLLNFTTEFLFSRFVMYRKSINTNDRAKK